jgi:hypothetical protein
MESPKKTPKPLTKDQIRSALLTLADQKMAERKARRIARKKLGLPPEGSQADEQSTPETDG